MLLGLLSNPASSNAPNTSSVLPSPGWSANKMRRCSAIRLEACF